MCIRDSFWVDELLMKKIIIFVVVWALLIAGGRFAVLRILDQKSNEAFATLHQLSTMLGMPVKIKYRKVFVDLDGSIGFQGVRVRSPQTGYIKIDRISYSNGSLLNLTRLLWHVSRISQAESATERETRTKNLFSSSALWRQQIIRSEGIVGFATGIEICGARFGVGVPRLNVQLVQKFKLSGQTLHVSLYRRRCK